MYINLKYFTFYPDFVEDIFKITRSDLSTWIGNINDSHCSCCKFSVNCKDGMQSITTTYLCFFAGTGSWLLVVSYDHINLTGCPGYFCNMGIHSANSGAAARFKLPVKFPALMDPQRQGQSSGRPATRCCCYYITRTACTGICDWPCGTLDKF
jgi:hypothetical protein